MHTDIWSASQFIYLSILSALNFDSFSFVQQCFSHNLCVNDSMNLEYNFMEFVLGTKELRPLLGRNLGSIVTDGRTDGPPPSAPHFCGK